MKISELLEQLGKYPADWEVFFKMPNVLEMQAKEEKEAGKAMNSAEFIDSIEGYWDLELDPGNPPAEPLLMHLKDQRSNP